MNLIELVHRESEVPIQRIALLAGVAGLAQAGVLATINMATDAVASGKPDPGLAVLFAVALVAMIYSQWQLFRRSASIFEAIIDRMRNRIAEKVRLSDMLLLEKVGKGRIYNRLSTATTMISDSFGTIVAAMQAVLVVTFSIMYIATLSMMAFVLVAGTIVTGTIFYFRYRATVLKEIDDAKRREVDFFAILTHLLDGFKEIKTNRQRSAELALHLQDVSEDVRVLKMRSTYSHSLIYVLSQGFFYVLIATVVFILPQFMESAVGSIVEMTATILFIIGPLSTLVAGIPAYNLANYAVEDLYRLEEEIDTHRHEGVAGASSTHVEPMAFNDGIEVHGLVFQYPVKPGHTPFAIGPVNMKISKGEMVYLVGDNGSGKSTFIKTLMGLYPLTSGTITVDGYPLTDAMMPGYRELFSHILTDFHLFDRLYGIRNAQPERVDDLLKRMELAHLTDFTGDGFTTNSLSTGQRKRLALLIATLEDRPIYIFDEWAAEQDPRFRKMFYDVLLQDLKKAGKTVLCASHDDRYFSTADRVLTMTNGKIV